MKFCLRIPKRQFLQSWSESEFRLLKSLYSLCFIQNRKSRAPTFWFNFIKITTVRKIKARFHEGCLSRFYADVYSLRLIKESTLFIVKYNEDYISSWCQSYEMILIVKSLTFRKWIWWLTKTCTHKYTIIIPSVVQKFKMKVVQKFKTDQYNVILEWIYFQFDYIVSFFLYFCTKACLLK